MQAEWAAGRLGLREVAWTGWWLAKYSIGLEGGLDGAFDQAVATLAGQEEAAFDAHTASWFETMVAHRARPGGLRAIQEHRERGERVVLATSGTIYAARAAQRAFDLDDAIGTELEVVDGRFTGKISGMGYGAAKRDLVVAWAQREGVDLAQSTFYTDSISDLALLEEVGSPRIVHPDPKLSRLATERDWVVCDWGTS